MSHSKSSAYTKKQSPFRAIAVVRQPLTDINSKRVIGGGRLLDLGRLPRYVGIFALCSSALWAPIAGYLTSTPLQYTSQASLILPGSGASASVNLNDIGQATSFANSAFSNGSISPTQTYKRLITADRILDAAAETLGTKTEDLPKPRVTLVDQTSFIHVEVKGPSPETAQSYGDALLEAFFAEIEALRDDEIAARQDSGSDAIEEYNRAIELTRADINELQAKSGLISAAQFRAQVDANDELLRQIRDLAAKRDLQAQKVVELERSLGLSALVAAATLKVYADASYLMFLDDVALHAADLAQVSLKYGSRHPLRRAAQSGFDAAREALLARAADVSGLSGDDLAGLDRAPNGERAILLRALVQENSTLSGLIEQTNALEAEQSAELARLNALGPIAAQLEDRQRDFDVAEAVFASAIARSEATKTDVYASYPLVQVLENPSLPDRPTSPNRKLSLAAGIAGTFMLFIGFVLAWVRRPIIERVMSRSFVKEQAPISSEAVA